MGGSIPKEKYIKICSSYFPLFRRKMLHFSDFTREKYILMVLNADHQRYKITYGYRISLLPLPYSKAVENLSTIWIYNSNNVQK